MSLCIPASPSSRAHARARPHKDCAIVALRFFFTVTLGRADAMAKSNTNRNHACVALATTSEAGAVDRRVVVHGLPLSAADIITSDGSAGGSPQPVTIADIVLYNDAGGVCCGASRRLAPPVLSEHAAIARASRGRRPRPGGIHFFARRDNLASSPSAYSSSYQQQASHHPRWRCCCF